MEFSTLTVSFPKNRTHLDQAGNKRNDIRELVKVQIEVFELVSKCLVENDAASLSDSTETAQVTSRIQLGVRRPGQIDLG